MTLHSRTAKAGRDSAASAIAVPAVLAAFFAAVTAAGLAFPFIGLTDASLWGDELWTLYLSDPALAPAELLHERIVRDVHPPLYYLMQNQWLRLFDDPVLGARLLGALCAAGLVAAVLAFGRRFLSMTGTLFLSALIVTSYAFIVYAHEARNYALVFALGTLLALLMTEALRRIGAERRLSAGLLTGLGAVAALAGLTHYYGFLLAGAVFGVILTGALAVRRWRDAALIAAVGTVVFAVDAGYALWQLPQATNGLDEVWIGESAGWYALQIKEFAWLAGGGQHGILAVLLGLAVAFAVAVRRSGPAAALARHALPVLPYAGAVLLVILFGMLLSALWAPSVTSRNLLVTVPMVWFGLAVAVDAALRSPSAWARRSAAAGAAVSIGVGAVFAAATGGAVKEEWRDSAAFVETLAACRDTAIPVAGPAAVHAPFGPHADHFYGFYLTRPDRYRFVNIRNPGNAGAQPEGDCPILLWAARELDLPEIRAVLDRAAPGTRIITFPNTRQWDCWPTRCRLFDRTREVGAMVVLKPAALP
ncbi:hypothetical protein HL658_29250 [Azospirillum sp. RWY-5-1]|uniref:Glycosyltransferase RgtA/B/C/D-like domain-containing protein n=1 Tax=Azospirillum oleiclasticum TaxID=2735135 RepID=A0ABX2TLW6_9PROT|nr:glycosyltransferase family 39 protein [Azospirillum oleiclasticum]NYZ16652.1 hypothetical protein [Azospirillum oleiclasticum]NYZ24139.1 hypothetical protein [Azospirillum oleiclasticum]